MCVSVGVAPSRLLAKLASAAAKPDGVRLVADQQAALHLLSQVPPGACLEQRACSPLRREVVLAVCVVRQRVGAPNCLFPLSLWPATCVQTPAHKLPGYGGKAAEAFERREWAAAVPARGGPPPCSRLWAPRSGAGACQAWLPAVSRRRRC